VNDLEAHSKSSKTARFGGDEIMQISRFGDFENFVCKWQEFVFDAFSYYEPVYRAMHESCGMAGFRRFDNSTCV